MDYFLKLLLILFGLTGILLLSIHFYLKTPLTSGKYIRTVFIFLRFLELSIIFLLIFFRFLSISFYVKDKPNLGILIDRSDSMNLIDGGKRRSDTINSIISGREFKKLINRSNPVFCTFGGDVLTSKKGPIFLPENLAKSTNISLAFKKLLQSIAPAKFNAVLLFSDGNYNRGLNPVYMAKDLGCR